jgi:hypothetical protein
VTWRPVGLPVADRDELDATAGDDLHGAVGFPLRSFVEAPRATVLLEHLQERPVAPGGRHLLERRLLEVPRDAGPARLLEDVQGEEFGAQVSPAGLPGGEPRRPAPGCYIAGAL